MTAQICGVDQRSIERYEDLIWSARKRIDIVRRNMCPETSCPLLNLGLACQSMSANASGTNKSGCVEGEIVDFVKQYSEGTANAFPDGRGTIHSPPVYTMSLSINAGPKNQLAKTNHAPVAANHLYTLSFVLTLDGLVAQERTNAAVVHAQARFMKMTLRGLDFAAK